MLESVAKTPEEREKLLKMVFEANRMDRPPEFFPPIENMERIVVALHGEFADKVLEAEARREKMRAEFIKQRDLDRSYHRYFGFT